MCDQDRLDRSKSEQEAGKAKVEQTPIIEVQGLTKEYPMGEMTVHALRGVDFTLFEGEFVVILGQSGSGKSTILNLIGGIDSPTTGTICYRGEDIADYNQRRLTAYRRTEVGFIFQFYNLIPSLTARENIELAAELSREPLPVQALLDSIDLGDRGSSFPSQLSGGQQQRIAIARALAKNPGMLLCDEPTGALDSATGIQVLRLLKDFNEQYGKTVVVITHNVSIGDMADRVIGVKDGLIDYIRRNESPISPEEVSW